MDFDVPPTVDADDPLMVDAEPDPDDPGDALMVDADPDAGEADGGAALGGAAEALEALIDGEPDGEPEGGALAGGGFPPFFALTNLFSLGKAICRSSFALSVVTGGIEPRKRPGTRVPASGRDGVDEADESVAGRHQGVVSRTLGCQRRSCGSGRVGERLLGSAVGVGRV